MYTLQTPKERPLRDKLKRPLNRDQNLITNALFLERVQSKLEQHFDESGYTVKQLAKDVNLSRAHLFRKLKKIVGLSVCGYISLLRLSRAKKMLQSKKYSVSEVAYMVGFSDPAYFSRRYSKQYGHPPSKE